MATSKQKYRFAQGRCGHCGTILAKKTAQIAAPGMRGDIPHGKCPGCGKLLPLVAKEPPEPEAEAPEA